MMPYWLPYPLLTFDASRDSHKHVNDANLMDVWPPQTMPPKGELPCGRSFAASWIWEGHLIVHGERMRFDMQWRD